jgi:hypothetical protein
MTVVHQADLSPMTEFGFPLVGDKVQELCEYASIAPFGKRNKSVVNLQYRNALELTVGESLLGLALIPA